MKAEYPYFTNRKFFTPLLVFYPLIFASEGTTQNWNFEATFSCKIVDAKKGGKKLVRGVKNFWFGKYGFSAFICTKN